MRNDKLPTFKVQLNMFTRFVFKLVFRVSGRSVPRDISSMRYNFQTYRRTQFICYFQVLPVKAY